MVELTNREIDNIKSQWESGVPTTQIVRTMPLPVKKAMGIISSLRRRGVLAKRERKCGKELVCKAFLEGMTNPYDIAREYGYKVGTVCVYLRNSGIHSRRPTINYKKRERGDRTKEIEKCLENGERISSVAKKFGVSKQWVSVVNRRRVQNV